MATRALYVWGQAYIVVTNASEQARFLDIIKANGYKTLYMNLMSGAGTWLPNRNAEMAAFITKCASLGVEVYAMLACNSYPNTSWLLNHKTGAVLWYIPMVVSHRIK